MNRREFVGGVIGGIAAAKVGVGGLYAYGAPAEAAGTPPQGAWIQNGLIDAGGSHEPYLFVVRRGGQSLDARATYEKAQSEELIRQLRDQGVEVFHTHLYKGFGMAAEKPEMEDTVKAAAIAHGYGMKVDTYIQWNTLMYETFFVEEPRAQGWVQCDALGQPVMLTYGYQQSYRYRPCFSNQQYLDYVKKIVRYAIQEVKTDFIHFDNFDLNAEPDSCHCDACKAGFRNRLRTKYSPAQRRERFGFEDVSYVNPPLWNKWNPPEKMNIIFDPAFQEWIDYRCQMMADALEQMAVEIRSLNPEVVVEINPGGIDGSNFPWYRGVDHSRLLVHSQSFWAEEPTQPNFLPDGRLISTIRTYKLARRYQNVALTYTAEDEAAIGECLAFNQTIGFAGESPLTPVMLKYIAFYRKNRDLYLGTTDLASVAVLRSYPSLTYYNSRTQLSTLLVEQSLIQANVPFRLVFDEDLNQLSPAACKVLILPDSECLSDDQLASIRAYVHAGGGLIATEQAGLYDLWRRLRVKPGLSDVIDHQGPAPAYEESVAAVTVSAGVPSQKEFGQGRSVYIPGLEFDGPLPSSEPYFTVGTAFWKRPRNWKQVIDAVDWTSRGDVPLQVSGPEYLVANLVEQPQKQRRIVHLVNYNTKNVPSIKGSEVKCAVPEGSSVRSVRLYAADSENSSAVNFRMQGQYVVFTVPAIGAYAVAAVSW